MSKISQMHPESKVWIFSFVESLSLDQEQALLERVDSFLESWKAHGAPLSAASEIIHHQFLVVAADEQQTSASGCSIDSLVRAMNVLTAEMLIDLAPIGTIFYLNGDNKIISSSRKDFARLVLSGDIRAETTVIDTAISKVSELTSFEKIFINSWHAKAFPIKQEM